MLQLQKNDPRPLYVQLVAALREEIAAGGYPDGALPDERTLAANLGLSRVTVRRAIADLTGDGMIERIRGRGTFVRGRAATAISGKARQPALREIAVIAGLDRLEIRSALYYQNILDGIQAAAPAEASISIRSCVHRPDAFAAGIAPGTGVIVLGILDQRVLATCAGLGVPTVLVDSAQPDGATLDQVVQDNRDSSCAAVTALIELGHRRIAHLTYGPTPAATHRREGWERALAANGLAADPSLVHLVACNATAAYARMRAILAAPSAPTAVYCATDEMALGAIAAVRDHGGQVPRELSVIGFGDVGHFVMPPLSTVRVPMGRLGETAVALLRERAADPSLPARLVALPSELIMRGTCDVPRPVVR
ncbi:MAG TPA: GntR family transcriptional regulator [Planctomycetota bacterium]|nr:GntR family transcriptional regulator [Planctomycetota bacterium]